MADPAGLSAEVLVAWLSRPGIPAGDSVNYTIFAALRVGFRDRFPPRLILDWQRR